jgi:hypothetical protein
MLTLSCAIRVCPVVSGDLQCQAILQGPNSGILQSLGWSGPARNLANATAQTFGALDQTDVQRKSCIGISTVTVAAVFGASVDGSANTSSAAFLPEISRLTA